MIVIGLTGGIGSGKTTAAKLFAKLGAPVIDADEIAHDLTQAKKPAFVEIVKHFTEQILLADGTINRSKLRNIIFSDPKEKSWLENLLHPLIRQEIERQIKSISGPYCIAVIPLLLEVRPYPFIDRILVVDATQESQIERVKIRDKTSPNNIEAILDSQLNRDERLTLADDVIHNTGSLEDLEAQVTELHQLYLTLGSK